MLIKNFRSTICSLLYLCASRPDIVLSIGVCARYQAVPKERHMEAINRILRYVVYTPRFGLWYPKGSNFSLAGYTDSDGLVVRMTENQLLGHAISLVGLW